jgi:uncharacterized protein
MSPMDIVIALGIGLVAGISSGLFGIGGGVIIVPMLLYFFKFQQQAATATSLIALVLPVGIFGIMNYYRSGFIQWDNVKVGLVIAGAMFVSTFFGSKIASQMQSLTLTRMFSVFLIIVAVRLWVTAK